MKLIDCFSSFTPTYHFSLIQNNEWKSPWKLLMQCWKGLSLFLVVYFCKFDNKIDEYFSERNTFEHFMLLYSSNCKQTCSYAVFTFNCYIKNRIWYPSWLIGWNTVFAWQLSICETEWHKLIWQQIVKAYIYERCFHEM